MTFVVTEACIRCKYMDCVEVCPVDCFHEGKSMLVIDPEECIDCNLCVPHCPVDAIVPDDELPKDQHQFLDYNEKMSKLWPVIDIKKTPPADADNWVDTSEKRIFLVSDEGVGLEKGEDQAT